MKIFLSGLILLSIFYLFKHFLKNKSKSKSNRSSSEQFYKDMERGFLDDDF